jgi:hypothetical protein
MTLERDGRGGPISLDCDNCHEVLETHEVAFDAAKDVWKEHGWIAFFSEEADEWIHRCPDCKGKVT